MKRTTCKTKSSYKKRQKNKRGQCQKMMMCVGLMMVFFSVFICTTAVTADAWEKEEPEKRYKYYTTVYVERDTTLWDIADKYMTEEYKDKRDYIDEVLEINQLTNDYLAYGITICVPYYSSEYK